MGLFQIADGTYSEPEQEYERLLYNRLAAVIGGLGEGNDSDDGGAVVGYDFKRRVPH